MAEKRLVFTVHVRDRMRERGISEDDVRKAVEHPDVSAPYQGAGRRIFSKAGSVPLIVGVREHEDRIIVVTVMRWETDDD